MIQMNRTGKSGAWKLGLGGLGAVGLGVAACGIACSIVVPLLVVLGLGAAGASAVEAGAEMAGKVMMVGGFLAPVLAGARWWRHRRDCGCDAKEKSGAADDAVGGSSPEGQPIACTLDSKDVHERLAEFCQMFERGYVGSEHIVGGVRWRFRASPGLEQDLRSLAEREHQCCRFFQFDIQARGDEIRWDTRVDDEGAEPVLRDFFTLPERLMARRPARAPEPQRMPGHALSR